MSQLNPSEVSATPTTTTLDLAAVKTRQQATWSSGDFSIIGTTLQIVGENLCETVDIRAGQRVLDVACGNGNATLAAARRWATTTGLDYVPALLADAAARAKAEKLPVTLVEGDAENMPFKSGEFDVVLSTFGVMFAPDHQRAANELLRVVRPGGSIGLANWTPDGFVGKLLATVGTFVPPPAGLLSPARWGTREHIVNLFGDDASSIHIERRQFSFRYTSAAHLVEVFRTYYGPTFKAFGALDPQNQRALTTAFEKLVDAHNIGGPGSVVVPADYLEIVITRAGGSS